MADNSDSEKKSGNARRKFLIGASAAVGSLGVIGAAVPFVKAWQPSARARALGGNVKVDISRLDPGEVMVEEWRGRPIFVIRRKLSESEAIDSNLSRLSDPDSEDSNQPDATRNDRRSLRPEITVLVGLCTHLGCSPKYFPDASPQSFDSSWQGGYFCPCHGSKFDLIGRVYKSVPAPTNMEIPPYRYLDSQTLLIGETEGEVS